jgi:hypothetical protein
MACQHTSGSAPITDLTTNDFTEAIGVPASAKPGKATGRAAGTLITLDGDPGAS